MCLLMLQYIGRFVVVIVVKKIISESLGKIVAVSCYESERVQSVCYPFYYRWCVIIFLCIFSTHL